MNKLFTIFAIIVLAYSNVKAQNPLSLYYLENIPQTSTINPAMVPRANGFFGFPLVNTVYLRFNTDLINPDIIQNVNGNDVSLLNNDFDYSKFYDRIGDAGRLAATQSITPLTLGFSGEKGYFTFSINEKLSQTIALPKDLFSIIATGFPADNTHDLSPLAINAQYYRELSAGYSYNFTNKLRVGIHAKLLQGIAAIKTDIHKMNLGVGYQSSEQTHTYLDFDMDANVYISAPLSFETNNDGSPSNLVMDEMNMDNILNTLVFNFKNPGMAFDVGACYELSEEWSFSGSLNDLGFLKWNSNLSTITTNGKFHYDGININGGDLENSGEVIGELLDSTIQGVKMMVSDKGFSSGLGPKLYLGAQYNVNHYFSAGALSRTSFIKNNFMQEFNVSANLNLYHFLTTTLNYTLATNGASTFGFGFALRGGPLQFYLVTDYLPLSHRPLTLTKEGSEPMEIPFTPTRLDNFNVMFGLNILIGANGFRDEPMIDVYNEY